MKTYILYDGTFDGFLTAIYYVYEYKLVSFSIRKEETGVASLFGESTIITTDAQKANRVWKSLSIKAGKAASRHMYKAFLSEIETIEDDLYYLISEIFKTFDQHPFEAQKIHKNYSNPQILKISKVVKSIDREKHRMDAFVRFKLTKDNIYFAVVEPDFNVLPLNSNHFKNRYADQKWMIYDLKRNYGIYYDLNDVAYVQLDLPQDFKINNNPKHFFTDEEAQFEKLWQQYFKSTTITSRKNDKLHIQHVPKRYWKYLSEKK